MSNNVTSLMRKFVKLESQLEKLHISPKNIVCGYGEYLARKKLKLKLEQNPNHPGYDGVRNGKKYQIKTTRNRASYFNDDFTVVFDFHNAKRSYFDYAILISIDKDFATNFLIKLPAKYVKSRLNSYDRFVLSRKRFIEAENIKGVKIIKMKAWIREWYNRKKSK